MSNDVLEDHRSLDDIVEAQLERYRQAQLLRAQAKFLNRKAGQMDQHERARQGIPPRAVLRALATSTKPGRRGRKAKARIKREAERKGIPWTS